MLIQAGHTPSTGSRLQHVRLYIVLSARGPHRHFITAFTLSSMSQKPNHISESLEISAQTESPAFPSASPTMPLFPLSGQQAPLPSSSNPLPGANASAISSSVPAFDLSSWIEIPDWALEILQSAPLTGSTVQQSLVAATDGPVVPSTSQMKVGLQSSLATPDQASSSEYIDIEAMFSAPCFSPLKLLESWSSEQRYRFSAMRRLETSNRCGLRGERRRSQRSIRGVESYAGYVAQEVA